MENKDETWAVHIENWRSGEVSQAEYCRRNGLKPYAFSYWKKRLSEPAETAFVAVEAPSRPSLFELTVHESLGFEIRLNLHLFWTSESLR